MDLISKVNEDRYKVVERIKNLCEGFLDGNIKYFQLDVEVYALLMRHRAIMRRQLEQDELSFRARP